MRPLWKDVLAAIWLGMIIPGIMLNAFVWKNRHQQMQQEQTQQMAPVIHTSPSILIRDSEDTISAMDLDTYLAGVLLAEMPAEFHEEALKAQAVAARTYTWKAYTAGGKHGDGSVCTDPACCQAYIDTETYLSLGGTVASLEKVNRAVRTTGDLVLVYDGELIEATYFASSGGITEAAVSVWGAEYPYLQSVSSPEDESFMDTVVYTADEFQHLLGKILPGDPEDWFGSVAYTGGAGVAVMEICAEEYTGVELRSLLGLRSTAFQVHTEGENIILTTRGYGHRVGMSQYGANAMANRGRHYQQILQHYYPGTILVPAVSEAR